MLSYSFDLQQVVCELMEVLAGYGSQSESDREPSPTPAGQMPGPQPEGSGALFSQLPAPSMTGTGSSSLLGNLPAPKAAAHRRQPIRLASTLTPLPDSDDEVCTLHAGM